MFPFSSSSRTVWGMRLGGCCLPRLLPSILCAGSPPSLRVPLEPSLDWSVKPAEVLPECYFSTAEEKPWASTEVMSLRITFSSYLEAFFAVAERFYRTFLCFSHLMRVCVALPCQKPRQLFKSLTSRIPVVAAPDSVAVHGRTRCFSVSQTTYTHSKTVVYALPCEQLMLWPWERGVLAELLLLKSISA